MDLHIKFWRLRERYRAVFQRGSRADEDLGPVLNDLREFCRADTSCVVVGKDGHIDTHATAVAEGRREVWLRIVQTLRLTDMDLERLKGVNDE